MSIEIRRVLNRADRKAFIDLAFRLNRDDPNWVPPLKAEVKGLITPGSNPWFEHAKAAFFLALEDGRPVGRISAQVDQLVVQHMGPGLGQWGLFEATGPEVAQKLFEAAEQWLSAQGMNRSMGPFSLSIWDEPGLLIKGHDHPPMVMMGHDNPCYEAWVEQCGYRGVKDLYTYELPSTPFPPIVQRIVSAGEKNAKIRIRKVDRSRFDEEAKLVLNILNDAWSDNWGFIPLTDNEIAYAGRKMKPIVIEDMVLVAEYEGEPVAFMLTLPDINPYLMDLKGKLFPFGWAKLMVRVRRKRFSGGRVPLMGVLKRLHSSRLASQLAFMMIEYIRRAGAAEHGIERAEVGWVLDDNKPMISIAEAIQSRVNRIYRIYEKAL